jgi:TRAP-type mannitol/chloroaromatic compound transport system substrate-binding protein
MKNIKSLVLIMVGVMLVLTLTVGACGGEEPAPAAPATTPTTPEAPAPEPVKTIKWIGSAGYGPPTTLWQQHIEFCERVNAASGGRLELTMSPPGSIVAPAREWDGINSGALDFGSAAMGMVANLFPWGGLDSADVAGISPMEHLVWHRTEGGALIQKLIDDTGQYNIMLIPGAVFENPPEMFLHTNVEVKTIDDLKELKIRATGDGAAVFNELDIPTVNMPSSELYEAMKRGVVDACEMGNAGINWGLSLQEVAKYVYLPGARAPREAAELWFNKTRWNELPDDLKVIVEELGRSTAPRDYAAMASAEFDFIQKFRDYGCTVLPVPEEIDKAIIEAASAYYAKKAADDPVYGMVLKSLQDFKAKFRSIYSRP